MKAPATAVVLVVLSASLARADVDWRSKGAVTPVKNQGQLCASWAFALTGIVEGAAAIQQGTLPNLSEQQLVDCASPACGGPDGDTCACAQVGCFFDYVQTAGLCSESSYPHTARDGTCKTTCMPVVPSGFANNWTRLSGEAGVTGALNSGPILARLEIGDNGQPLQSYVDYSGGLFAPTTFDSSVVQWVEIVGYTSSYFIVKNSLGTAWGSSGYLLLARGANRLGVGNFAYALAAGTASQGACTLSGTTCMEMTSDDCSLASGSFGGVGTFCMTTCAAPSPTLTETPTQSPSTTPTDRATATASPTSTASVTPSAGENGARCAASLQCQSGFCVTGVCCESVCSGLNQRCDVRGRDGACVSIDPAPAPTVSTRALITGIIVLVGIGAIRFRRGR